MRMKAAIVPAAIFALALGSVSADAAQRDRRSDRATQRGERNRQNQGANRAQTRGNGASARNNEAAQRRSRDSQAGRQSPQRGSEAARQRDDRGGNVNRGGQRADERNRNRDTRPGVGYSDNWNRGAGNRNDRPGTNRSRPGVGYSDNRAVERGRNDYPRRDLDRGRSFNRGTSYDRGFSYNRGNSRSYYAPRVVPRRLAPRRYYGSGGYLSLYFGWGSGYRYGSPYYGRVYGYRGPVVSGYSGYRYYGDVRLKITPRDAAVYVDGYYAGIVDDFDGFFQRLTLEVGPHLIEVEAPGLESQVFDVYVDPNRTVDLHGDLFRY